ncbi:MAG TPA: PSD1 and planctomycete cytochrome C domain-containing protein [Gemmataceae bacterium]|jgi:mono/diheme cytochrome c family protein|nr:PSD1 and planctomycete cytochrome C domain-containing protein [Gemmataceae bacterium]
MRIVLAVCLTLPGIVLAAGPEKEFSPEALAFYDREVLPILKVNCFKCHADGKLKGNFSLATRAGILKGGDLGPAVNLEKADDSNLLKAVRYKDGLEMPPTGKLKPEQVETLAKWVKSGLAMKDSGAVAAKVEHKGGTVTAESKNYWAYKPVQRPTLPQVKNASWVVNPIDAFILAKLEAKGLSPAAPSARVALVRRLYYDLIGLPPTPDQVDAFVNDKSDRAYETLVDNLLASPHYGEKWGRHWLDVVRYAETNGYERDNPKPFVWKYRDYVIRSFNADKPYDQFIREQLAGDEMPGFNPDAIIATGYFRLGLWDDEPADPLQAMYDEYDDMVATTAQAFLGMTMNCARCHDHKIDPIPQKDYYSMVAFFRDIRRYSDDRNVRSAANITDITPPERRSTYEGELRERKAKIAELTRLMTAIEDAAIKKMPAEDQRAAEANDRPQVIKKVPNFLDADQKAEYRRLGRNRAELEKKPDPSQDLALSVNNCVVRPPTTNVMTRGNPHSPAAVVQPAFPEVLGFPAPKINDAGKDARSSGRRTVLANWITSKDNQLTARVMVNRVWQGHFGRGIVASSNDFGKFGTGPTHPELLDWLASEFVARGWKIKSLHKLILMSQTYQMSAQASPEALRLDPGNMLFGRFNMRRLTAEEVRDSILMVSGQLDLKPGGPSVYPKISDAVLAGQSIPGNGWIKKDAKGEGYDPKNPTAGNRRSVYVHVKRSLQVPILIQHDQADADGSCPVRYTTTVPTQALGMLNGEFTNSAAAAFAGRLQKQSSNLDDQVRAALRLIAGRVPTDAEVCKDVAFVNDLKAQAKLSDAAALQQYCLLALNLNEFVYLD